MNAFRDPDDASPEPRYPLDVARCRDCTLVQLTSAVSPDVLFREYSYFSSYSDTFLDHARDFAETAVRRLKLGPESFVVEVASNDGYLLQYFRPAGIRVLGIEPAQNVAEVAEGRGIDTLAEFLDQDLAQSVVQRHGPADLVIANNVFAHVPDPNGFLSALATLADERGRISIEVPYVRDLVDRVEFDTIYHEHVSYFSVTALTRIAERHGLVVLDVERLPVHGGSLRVWLAASGEPSESIAETLAREAEWGVAESPRYRSFADAAGRIRSEIHDLVASLAARASVGAYGAAAKGVVLANVCALNADRVRFAADRNVYKQGKVFPGVRIPVVPPDALLEQRPDYCVLFAWNLEQEILAQQRAYREAGGRFVVLLPTPRVLEA